MRRALLLVLIALLVAACGVRTSPASAGQEQLAANASLGVNASPGAEVDAGLHDLDTLEQDLNFSDLDTLDQDLNLS